jgi:hypothetical protein
MTRTLIIGLAPGITPQQAAEAKDELISILGINVLIIGNCTALAIVEEH